MDLPVIFVTIKSICCLLVCYNFREKKVVLLNPQITTVIELVGMRMAATTGDKVA